MSIPQLNAEKIFRQAEEKSAFGLIADDAMRQRFAGLVARFNAGGRLTTTNLSLAEVQCEARVIERLKLENDMRSNPDICNEKIERPIFVVGYARTGTTVMHSLLGEDSSFRMPRFWEGLHFSPPPGLDPTGGADKIAAADAECEAFLDYLPGLLAAHPYWDIGAQTPIEDEELFSIDFHTAYPTHFYRVPFSPTDTAASDPLPAYQFLKRFLQYQQYKTTPRYWVCKGVMHQFFLDKIWKVFPDALCVWTHRDPAEVVASTLGIYTTVYDPITGGVDRPDIARRMVQSIRSGYDHILNQPWVDDPRVIHVRFKDFIADHVGVLRGIYQKAGLPFSTEHEHNVRAWLANNKADRHGTFKYSMDGFGITQDELRALFADYVARFELD